MALRHQWPTPPPYNRTTQRFSESRADALGEVLRSVVETKEGWIDLGNAVDYPIRKAGTFGIA